MTANNDTSTPEPKSNTGAKLSGILVLLAGVAAAAVLIFLPPGEGVPPSQNRPPPPVLVEQIQSETLPLTLESLGTVRANEQATLSAKVTDQITGLYFDDGELVEAGQLLVQLNDEEQQALLVEAQSLLQERERQVERIKQVEGTGALSKSLIDEEQSKLTRARAGVSLIEAAIADRNIKAPFSGQVGLRNVSLGELVTPGKTLAVISDLTPVKVDFTAPERFIGSLAVGLEIRATSVAFPGRTFSGEIFSVSPIVDPVTRAAQVRAIIPNEDLALRPGMLLNVVIELGHLETLTVNEAALTPQGEKQFAMQVADGVAKRVEVQIGRRLPGKVEVLSGLKAGDSVVTEGFRVVPGQPVTITTEEEVFSVGEGGQ